MVVPWEGGSKRESKLMVLEADAQLYYVVLEAKW